MSREIALLSNPTAGKGAGAKAAAVVVPRLRQAGFAVRHLTGGSAEESLELARQCVAEGVDTLVVCGGDGMAHLGVQAVAGSDTRLGVVPAGTGNDLARNLGIPRKDLLAAADVVVGSVTRRIDLARAGATYFVTVLAAGFDAMVNERANAMTWPRGQMRYNLATVAELRTLKPISYVLELDGQQRRVEAILCAVGNGPSFGGGLRIAEGAELDDGLLDVVLIKPVSRRELLRTYPKLFKGTHTTHPQYEHARARSVTLAASDIVAYADGERLGPLPMTIECVPGALEVLVPAPRHAQGPRP